MQNKQRALADLLLELFPDDSSLLRFVRFGTSSERTIGTLLPGLSGERLVLHVVDALGRRGLVTLELFDALREYAPQAEERISEVAAAWVPSIEDWRTVPTEDEDEPPGPALVFVSYARRDVGFLDELLPHLSLLQRRGVIDTWHEGRLRGGDHWASEIERQLQRARVILLLVSTDFLSSDFIWGSELPSALERSRRGEATVIPIIVRRCAWEETPLANLQVLPEGGLPVVEHDDTDSAWLQVARAVTRVISGQVGD